MKKWLPTLALALAMTGCAKNGAPVSSSLPESSPPPTATASSSASPSASASSSASAPESPSASPEAPSPSQAVLDIGRLGPLFGFANKEGTKLISLPVSPEEGKASPGPAETYRQAVGEGGQVLTIRFEKHQSRTEQDNGRDAAHNFANLEGDVYEVEGGTATPNASYYLLEEGSLLPEALIPVRQEEARELTPDQSSAIAEAKGRAIDQGWLLATLEDGRGVFAVQFERQGEDVLASLAVDDGERWLFLDYPAKYDENSTWRVDDGGEISPFAFSFLFAARSEGGLALGVKWMGAEGENLSIVEQKGDRFEETSIVSGRYQSPI